MHSSELGPSMITRRCKPNRSDITVFKAPGVIRGGRCGCVRVKGEAAGTFERKDGRSGRPRSRLFQLTQDSPFPTLRHFETSMTHTHTHTHRSHTNTKHTPTHTPAHGRKNLQGKKALRG